LVKNFPFGVQSKQAFHQIRRAFAVYASNFFSLDSGAKVSRLNLACGFAAGNLN
jgi:hypothetical protein